MTGGTKEIFMTQLIEEANKRIAKSGAKPSLDTLDLLFFMSKLGSIMRDAGSRKKVETLTMLREWGENLAASGEPTQIAEGFLIGEFAATCFGRELNR